MNHYSMLGKIHSFQSLGTLDGPGIRYVVFLQGCNLRCSCCHNPDTWDLNGGTLYSVSDIISKVVRYKEYFNDIGGLTVSGGEPLLQSEFVKELFIKAKEENINTCLDTSGSVLNEDIVELLKHTDYVLLDIKYTTNEKYLKYVGCSFDKVISFLEVLEKLNVNTIIRQVIVPSINDNIEDTMKLIDVVNKYSVVRKIELLPFKKICISKYQKLGIKFPFENIDEPNIYKINELNDIINSRFNNNDTIR